MLAPMTPPSGQQLLTTPDAGAPVSSPVTDVPAQEPTKGSGEQEEEHEQGSNTV